MQCSGYSANVVSICFCNDVYVCLMQLNACRTVRARAAVRVSFISSDDSRLFLVVLVVTHHCMAASDAGSSSGVDVWHAVGMKANNRIHTCLR